MSPLSVILFQEAVQRERETRTILGFLSEQMDRENGSRRTRIMTLKQRLGFKGLGCCAAIWALRPTTIPVGHDLEETTHHQIVNQHHGAPQGLSDPHCLGAVPVPAPTQNLNRAVSSMNLAAALAAERQFREGGVSVGAANGDVDQPNDGACSTAAGTPLRVSLMRLLEETEVGEGEEVESSGGREAKEGSDRMCCVCTVRKKGAAFIPCGHTFCRECSRELWLNRGSCPLCNRSILDILDIF